MLCLDQGLDCELELEGVVDPHVSLKLPSSSPTSLLAGSPPHQLHINDATLGLDVEQPEHNGHIYALPRVRLRASRLPYLYTLVVASARRFHNGKLFKIVQPHVDTKLPPGASTIPLATFSTCEPVWTFGYGKYRPGLHACIFAGLKNAPFVLWQTSNGAWALLALAFYLAFPYDLSPESAASRGPLTFAFFASRFPLWLTGMLVFYSFWHVTLYCFGLADRPFASSRTYNFAKVAHNIFWGVTGLTILVCFENVFAFLWATGRLPYEADAQAFGTVTGGFAAPSGCTKADSHSSHLMFEQA